jgi:uncharacterized membrane protein (DUF4010 family)
MLFVSALPNLTDYFGPTTSFPYLQTLLRLMLALSLGLFIGLERERRGKEAGLRTFGFAALLGGLCGLLGDMYALLGLSLLGILVVFLNWATLRNDEGLELTTSAALLVTGFIGVLAGQGHTFTPVSAAIASAAMLAWKERLAGFSLGLTEVEVRSAILLAVLAFIVYPVLPQEPLDPWDLIEPRAAWLTVILIAAIGFANYVLLKLYGRRGVELAGFLGGLVNSSVTVAELGARARETGGRLADLAYRGVLLATAAMAVRNAVILGLLTTRALTAAAPALVLMVASSLVLAVARRPRESADPSAAPLALSSPFSLQSALKFGVIFLLLQVGSTMAQDALGDPAFYVVSLIGGCVSSASAVASAGALAAHGSVTPAVAGTGAVIASLASAAVNLPLIARVSRDRALTVRVGWGIASIMLVGLAGAAAESMVIRA